MQVRLKVLKGKSAGRKIAIPGPRFLIGRGDDCDLRPKSDAISRKHCEIEIREDEVLLSDFGSKNGTYLDDVRIEETVPLRSGSILRIGRLEFEVIVRGKVIQPSPTGTDSGAFEETDITDWLDETDVNRSKADPETRQFKLDDTERVKLEEAKAKPDQPLEKEDAAKESEPEEKAVAEDKSDQKEKKDRRKPKPGKLPPRSAATTDTSQEAAADMLKKFFNRP